MQSDPLLTGNTLSVQILGVNGIGHDSDNAIMCNGRALPWLQDQSAVDIWTSWQVTYRDVILLNDDNTIIGVFNVTDQDLGDAVHYNALRDMILNATSP